MLLVFLNSCFHTVSRFINVVMRHLGVLPSQEALLKAAVHGERDERHQPPVLQQPERGQEGVAERLPATTELAGLIPVDVVQKHGHDEHGQHAHTCRKTYGNTA